MTVSVVSLCDTYYFPPLTIPFVQLGGNYCGALVSVL